jgi:hypothetical protein
LNPAAYEGAAEIFTIKETIVGETLTDVVRYYLLGKSIDKVGRFWGVC